MAIRRCTRFSPTACALRRQRHHGQAAPVLGSQARVPAIPHAATNRIVVGACVDWQPKDFYLTDFSKKLAEGVRRDSNRRRPVALEKAGVDERRGGATTEEVAPPTSQPKALPRCTIPSAC